MWVCSYDAEGFGELAFWQCLLPQDFQERIDQMKSNECTYCDVSSLQVVMGHLKWH
jgi:hypothetical protein